MANLTAEKYVILQEMLKVITEARQASERLSEIWAKGLANPIGPHTTHLSSPITPMTPSQSPQPPDPVTIPEKTAYYSDPFIESLKHASVLQVPGSVSDVFLVHRVDSHVKEVEESPQQPTNSDDKNVAHQVFAQMPLGVTSKEKQRKTLKAWKFKFKISFKRSKLMDDMFSFVEETFWLNRDPKETIWDFVKKECKETMAACGEKTIDRLKLADETSQPAVYDRSFQIRVWDSGGSPLECVDDSSCDGKSTEDVVTVLVARPQLMNTFLRICEYNKVGNSWVCNDKQKGALCDAESKKLLNIEAGAKKGTNSCLGGKIAVALAREKGMFSKVGGSTFDLECDQIKFNNKEEFVGLTESSELRPSKEYLLMNFGIFMNPQPLHDKRITRALLVGLVGTEEKLSNRLSLANYVWKPGELLCVQDQWDWISEVHSGGGVMKIMQRLRGTRLQGIIYMDMKVQEVIADDVLSVIACLSLHNKTSEAELEIYISYRCLVIKKFSWFKKLHVMSLQENSEMVLSLAKETQDWRINSWLKTQVSSVFDLKAQREMKSQQASEELLESPLLQEEKSIDPTKQIIIWIIFRELCSAGYEWENETIRESFKELSKHKKDHKLLFPKNQKLLNPEAKFCTQYNDLEQLNTEHQFHLQRPPELINIQGNPNFITTVLVQWKEHPPDQFFSGFYGQLLMLSSLRTRMF